MEFYGFADKDGVPIKDEVIRTLPAYMLIRLDHDIGVPVALPGLPFGVVAIEPCETTFRNENGSVTFRQFPVSLAFAITDYRCQGQTFPWVVVDLKKPAGNSPTASPYVQLSRAKRRDQLSILRPFSPDELKAPISLTLKRELEWESAKAQETKALYP